MRRGALLILFYLLADTTLAVLCIGFYHTSWAFDADLIARHLLLLDGYSMLTNPLDFVVLSVARLLLLAVAMLLMAFHYDGAAKHMLLPMVGFAASCYSYSLVKLLLFSEDSSILYYPGVWMSITWNILSAGIFALLWFFVVCAKPVSVYVRLPSRSAASSSETVESPPQTSTTAQQHEPDQAASCDPTLSTMSTWQHVRKLLAYCGKEWFWFSSGFVFLTAYALLRVFTPAMMGRVVSDIVNRRGFDALFRSIGYMAALIMASTVASGIRGGCFDYATALVSRQVRLDLFASLVRQDIAFFDVNKSGEMVSRLTSDCQTISSAVSTNLNIFLRNGVMLIGAVIYMLVMSWRLAMISFIAIPIVGFITKCYGAFFDRISNKMQATIAKANQMAEEVLSTMRTVRSFACEKRETRRFEDHLHETLDMSKKKSIAYMGLTWTNETFDNLILIAVLFYGGHLVMTGRMDIDSFITFLLYQMQLGENLYYIGYVATALMECVGSSRKVFEYMWREPDMPLDGQLRPQMSGNITFDDVHFTYPSRPNNPVLKGLNLKIGAGETVALVGPSGGGKSSIVSLIEHFYEPTSGSIRIDDVPLKDVAHVYYHQRVALVAQEPVLYNGSVRNNILYGCDYATEDDMLAAAKTANVHDFVMDLEKGYDTNCGERGVQMSGGQKQRIAIARALVRNPAVLIFDEATSALDAESERLVLEALQRCARERTVLIIAHRLSTIENADRIVVIFKGSVMQSGKHTELMADKDGLYYSLVSRQLLSTQTS